MGPVNRREREKEKLKKQILDAARYLFARDGYDSVTMRAIAERIEYSPRTLYLHFQDKEVLIRELCRNDFSEFGKGFAKLATVKDPIQRLKALVWPMRGLARISQPLPAHVHVRGPGLRRQRRGGMEGRSRNRCLCFSLERRRKPSPRAASRSTKTRSCWPRPWAGIHGVLALHSPNATTLGSGGPEKAREDHGGSRRSTASRKARHSHETPKAWRWQERSLTWLIWP